MLGGGGRTKTQEIGQTSDKIIHNELTNKKVNSINDNKAININDYNNIENNNSNNIDKIYKINKVNYKNCNSNIDTYNKLVTKKNNTFIKTALLIVSWLFVVVLSIFVLCSANANSNMNKLNTPNNAIAVGSTTDDGTTASSFAGGTGDPDDPYQIATPMQLRLLSIDSSYWADSFIQTANITYTTDSWNPIGNATTKFTGNFNGGGYVIKFDKQISFSNFTGKLYSGLFGYVQQGELLNISVKWESGINASVDLSGIDDIEPEDMQKAGNYNAYVGGIVGYAINENIYNCQLSVGEIIVQGNVNNIYGGSGWVYAGGIVGYAVSNSIIKGCKNAGMVSASANVNPPSWDPYGAENAFAYSGGIVGYGECNMYNCLNLGETDADSRSTTYGENLYSYSGGIAGVLNGGAIYNSYNAGNCSVSGSYYFYLGGIASVAESVSIVNCFNVGGFEPSGIALMAGISGNASGIIQNCFNTGDVSNYYGDYGNSSGIYRGTATAENCQFSSPNEEDNIDGTTYNADLTSNLFQQENTFTNSENNMWHSSSYWDFTNEWNIDTREGISESERVNSGYPYLRAMEEYAITYTAGEGTGDEKLIYYGLKSSSPQATLPNGTASEIEFVAPDGMAFDCWVDESAQTYQSGQQVTLTENLVLTAQWKVPYIDFNIALDFNGGKGGTVTQLEVKQSVPQKTQFATNELPTRSGYTFNGYYTSQTNGTMYVNSAGQVVKTNTSDYLTQIPTLYAQWVANTYTIVFNSNGGQGQTMQSMSMTYDTPKNLTKNAYSRDDYTFIGWATTKERADSGQVDYVDEAQVNIVTTNNDTITLYAVWKSNYVGVTFNITTNVGVIFNVYDSDNNFVQQIYIGKSKNNAEQTISTQLLKGKTYTIRMSAFSSANITLDSINSMSGVSMSGRTLTIIVNESSNTITMNVSGYTFGNGIIV